MILWGMILFIISNIGFQTGLGFYDAFIKEISAVENYNKVSSFGYAIGYVGSLAALVTVIIWQDEPRITFIACSAIFLIFAMPMFIFIKEEKIAVSDALTGSNFIKIGYKRTVDTLKH